MEKFSIVSGGVHHQYHYCLGGYLAGNDVQGVKTTQLLIHRGCILIKKPNVASAFITIMDRGVTRMPLLRMGGAGPATGTVTPPVARQGAELGWQRCVSSAL